MVLYTEIGEEIVRLLDYEGGSLDAMIDETSIETVRQSDKFQIALLAYIAKEIRLLRRAVERQERVAENANPAETERSERSR